MKQSFQLLSDPAGLAGFRGHLRELLAKAGFDEKKSGEVVLAVDETLTNIIRHSRGGKQDGIGVEFSDFPDRIEVLIRDQGEKFDPTTVPPPGLPPDKPGGLGIYLMKTLVDRMEYIPFSGRGNRLRLTKLK